MSLPIYYTASKYDDTPHAPALFEEFQVSHLANMDI